MKKINKSGITLLSGVSLIFLATLPESYAQGAEAEVQSSTLFEEIIVTARKRAESLQDIPVAVTAFSSEGLENRNISQIDEISRYTPNIQFDAAAPLSGASFAPTIFIRGVGQNDFDVFSDPGVGVYVDGIYAGRSVGSLLDAVDLQSIEILRGPQGTFFGKNTIGGAINVTTIKPSEELGGKASLTAGTDGWIDFTAALNGTLVEDKLYARATVATLNKGGYQERISDGVELGDKGTLAGRLQLLWKASEQVEVSFAVDGTRTRQNGSPSTLVHVDSIGFPFMSGFNAVVAPALAITAPDGSVGLSDAFITDDIDKTYATGPHKNELDVFGLSMTIDWDLGEMDFKSLTAYREMDAKFGRDADGSPYDFRHSNFHTIQNQFSQEFQLSGNALNEKLDWMAGVYYFEETGSNPSEAIDFDGMGGTVDVILAGGLFAGLEALPGAVVLPGGPPFPIFGGAGNPANRGLNLEMDIFAEVHTVSYAAFGHGTYNLSDKLSASLGLRYTREEKDFNFQQVAIPSGVAINEEGVERKEIWSEFSPKFGLEYRFEDNVLGYASVAKGFKSGNFNGRPKVDFSETAPFDPETVWSYEVGLKSSLLDDRLILNIAAFYADYKNIQISVNQTPLNFIANAAAARIKGLEIELKAALSDNFLLEGSLGYLDAEYKEVGGGLDVGLTIPITTDDAFVRTPEVTANLGAQYSVELASDAGALTFRVDWSYQSEVFFDPANNPLLSQDGFGLLGARITYAATDDTWKVALLAKNITDKRYAISGSAGSSAFGNITELNYARGQEFALTFSTNF